MESKIRIRLGEIEVEYEGSQEFLKKDLPELIKTVSELHRNQTPANGSNGGNGGATAKADQTAGDKLNQSTNSIAAKLKCQSGPELVLAAAAHLTLDKGFKTFSRKQLRTEMQTASNFYKRSYGSNLIKILKTLLQKELNEPSASTYSLADTTLTDIRNRLADT